MRNLKRALSLTLASVMLLGMMVLGTSAAVAYPDVTDEHNVEAIEVLQAVGVMSGSNNGNFNPDSKISRIEMAIVMSNLLDLDPDYFQGQNTFSDVPEWASGYVNACAANGIVTGVGGGRFGTGNVTATQAALMMLKALGYFQYNSDFGGDWARATANQAAKIRLFDGIDVRDNTQLTRNQVAQLALNAIESGMVDADNSGTINVVTPDGTTVTNGNVNYVYRSSTQSFANQINTTEQWNTSALVGVTGSVIELGEQLYNGNLKRYDDTNNFGAPSVRWTYKNSEIGNYADEADYKFEGEVKSNAMYSAVGKTAAENYLWTVKMDGMDLTKAKDVLKDADLKFFSSDDVADNDKDTLDGTKRGAVTYVYLDDDEVRKNGKDYSGTATVCIVNTYAAEITKVDGDTVTLDDMDGSGLEYDITGYAEEDTVLYTKSRSGSSWTVESILGKAELVEGKADTIRNADRVVIGDKTYRYSYRFFDGESDKLSVDSVDENVAFYIDQQGNIIMLADAAESNDYAYVYSVGKASSKYSDDADFGAKLILSDGTTKNVDIDSDDTDAWKLADGANSKFDDEEQLDALRNGAFKGKDSDEYWDPCTGTASGSLPASVGVMGDDSTHKAPLVGQIVSYTEDNGVYSLDVKTTNYNAWAAAATDIVKDGNSRIKIGSSTIYADKNSAILVNPSNEDRDEYDAYVGYENAPSVDAINGTKMTAYVKDGVVKAVYITNAEVTGSDDIIFVIGATNPKENGTGSNKYYVYDAVVNGEVTTLRVKSNSDAATTLFAASASSSTGVKKNEIGIFFGMTQNSSGYVTKLTTRLPGDTAVNDIATQTGSSPEEAGNWTAKKYTGTRRANTDGLLGFGLQSDGTYKVRPAVNADATIVYYDGSDFETGASVITDSNDWAWVVTDDGVVTAVFVWEQKDGSTTTPDPDEKPAYGLTLKGDTLTFTYTVGDTSGIRTAIRDLLEAEDYTNVKVSIEDGKITAVTAEDNGDEIKFTLKKTEIGEAAGSASDLPSDADYQAIGKYVSFGVSQTFDPETKTVSMSGNVTKMKTSTSMADDSDTQAALKAFADDNNKTFSAFESTYDLKDGAWGFVTVNIGGTDYVLLVGEAKSSRSHEWTGFSREGCTVATNGKGIILRDDATQKVVFLSEYTIKGVKINVNSLTLPTANS